MSGVCRDVIFAYLQMVHSAASSEEYSAQTSVNS